MTKTASAFLEERNKRYQFLPEEHLGEFKIRRFKINPNYYIREDGAIFNGRTNKRMEMPNAGGLNGFRFCIYDKFTRANWFSSNIAKIMAFPSDLDGYRLIPRFTCYMVNEDGVVRNSIDFRELSTPPSARGYKAVSLISDDGNRVTKKVHHLVLMAFKPEEYDKVTGTLTKGAMVVNHIDGNKLNNNINNLEVVTISENVKHAFNTGLTTANKPVVIRWEETGEEKMFVSMKEASEYLGRQADCILQRLERPDYLSCLWYDGTRVRLVSDGEWLPITVVVPEGGGGNASYVVAKEMLTGKETIFPSIKKLHEKYGFDQMSVRRTLNKMNQPLLDGLIRLKEDMSEPWIDLKDGYIDLLHELTETGWLRIYVLFKNGEYPVVIMPSCKLYKDKTREDLRVISTRKENTLEGYTVIRYDNYILTDHYKKYGQDLSKFTFIK